MGCPKREVALQCNKLMGMCDLMKSYFCDSGLTQQCYIFDRVTRILLGSPFLGILGSKKILEGRDLEMARLKLTKVTGSV